MACIFNDNQLRIGPPTVQLPRRIEWGGQIKATVNQYTRDTS